MPDKFVRKVLAILYPPNGTYESAYTSTFEDSELPSATPTFSSSLTVESAVPKFYISEAGIKGLQTVLWLINHTIRYIYYSPTIGCFGSILLIYVNEVMCYEILRDIVTRSNSAKHVLDKFFALNADEFRHLVAVASKVILKNVENLEIYLDANRIDFSGLLADIIKVFFIGYFKLPFVTRALTLVMCEGNRGLVKILVAVFKILSENFSEFKGDFCSQFKSCCFNYENFSNLFKTANKIKLPNNFKQDLQLPDLKNLTCLKYSRPQCNFSSKLASICELELIWSNIPNIYSHCALDLFFSTDRDGFSLRSFLRKSSSLKRNTPFIILIQSESHGVLGVFVDCTVNANDKYVGGHECFIFTLRPTPALYFSTGANDMHAFVSDSIIMLGGGKTGSALTIDKDLLKCTSSECETYGNPVLISESFNLLSLEAITLNI